MKCILGTRPIVASIIIILSILPYGFSQQFDSTSDDSDGALELIEEGEIIFDPTEMGLDSDGDGIYHFTTVTIGENTVVKFRADRAGERPITWLASGDVVIDGILDLNGGGGITSGDGAIPGPGGYRGGGIGGDGKGPGAGTGFRGQGGSFQGSAGGAGHAGSGANGTSRATSIVPFKIWGGGGSSYGNTFLLPLLGGSGGGGAIGGSSGGAGGGAILIASNTKLTVNGSITTNGGVGGFEVASPSRSSGGGSGGAIRLISLQIEGNGSLISTGGKGNGNPGSSGRIRLEAFRHEFTGSANPGASKVTPGLLFPPANGPSVRVTRIAGNDVSTNPTGGFTSADVQINEAGEVTFEIEAQQIPLGTEVTLTMHAETGQFLDFTSTPLEGTVESSTATATATIPHGFSRFTIEANWTP